MATTFTITLTGMDKIASAIPTRWEGVRRAAGIQMFAEASRIMAQAKALTPVDTGALRNSGFVALPKVIGNETIVVLGFGGPATPYAIQVHENLMARHPRGQAKFLEQPFRAAVEGYAQRLADGIRARAR